MAKRIIEWLAFLLFLVGQLSIIVALWFNSFFITRWLDINRSGAALPSVTLWCFRNGATPYIEMVVILTLASLTCRLFDKHFPFLFVWVSLGLLFIFIATYIVGISCITSHWGTLLNPK